MAQACSAGSAGSLVCEMASFDTLLVGSPVGAGGVVPQGHSAALVAEAAAAVAQASTEVIEDHKQQAASHLDCHL